MLNDILKFTWWHQDKLLGTLGSLLIEEPFLSQATSQTIAGGALDSGKLGKLYWSRFSRLEKGFVESYFIGREAKLLKKVFIYQS